MFILYLKYLPWPENRPYNDGFRYNCLVLHSIMKNVGRPHHNSLVKHVLDEVKWSFVFELHFTFVIIKGCHFTKCPVCQINQKVRSIQVRGLCPESIFNTNYKLFADREGRLRFLGEFSSSIKYNRDREIWQWFDMKDNKSVAIRTKILSWKPFSNCIPEKNFQISDFQTTHFS